MRKVLLYWNHICILHNQEKLFLKELQTQLKAQGIDLEIQFFGLGYTEHMSDYLRRNDAILPDMIVSADLEVYEDSRIYNKLKKSLYPLREQAKLKSGRALEVVDRGVALLPYVAIPLVYYTSDPTCCQDKELIEIEGMTFGGINNSAGKTIVKAVWNRYGKERVADFIEKAKIYDMPINSFVETRKGINEIALVPSLYAMRADNKNFYQCVPKEGPILIPSYICARNTISLDVAQYIIGELFSAKWSDFYRQKGDLILYPPIATNHSWIDLQQYFVPEKEWLEKTTAEEFYELYDVI